MIDWTQVQQLEADVGAENLADVIALFLDEVDEAIAPLRAAEPPAPDQIVATLHFLKGSAFSLGFKSFGEFCSAGEQKAKAGRGAEVDLAQAVTLYDQSRAEFLADANQYCSYEAAAA